jgi:spermidine synthase
MSGTGAAAERYMRAMAHLPLLAMDEPRDVLVICFGVGNTLSAAALHPSLTRLEVADLSQNVLEHAGWFAATNAGVLHDPRVSVFVDDGRHRLQAAPPAAYDLVTLEPPPITAAGDAALYSTEFYRLVRSRLRPGGFLTQWLPAYQAPAEVTLAMVRAFVDVFPESALVSGDRAELILVGTNAPSLALDPERVTARLAARPRVAADLARIRMGTLTELLGAFAADGGALREATAAVAPITDDRPTMEYAAIAKTALPTRIPASLFRTDRIDAVCPRCAGDPRLAALPAYLAVLGRFYSSEQFQLHFDYRPDGVHLRPGYLDDDPAAADTIAASAYLRSLLPPR